MTTRQQREWQQLCLRAVKEPDPDRQLEIVAELNRLLQGSKKATSTPSTRPPRHGR